MTGEMIDGDVIFDASWIKTWKEEYAFLVGVPTPTGTGADRRPASIPLAMGEIISPIMASKQGFGLPVPPPGTPRAALLNASLLARPGGRRHRPGATGARMAARRGPLGLGPDPGPPVPPDEPGPVHSLQLRAPAKASEMRFAALALAMLAERPTRTRTRTRTRTKKDKEPKLPEEFLGQAIKEVVMHEVGHSLGLRHNFKASTMLRPDQINDTSITRVKGMAGSVMDYNPINIAPKGKKQGDYASTTIGPYDYWAIEYAYKPVDGDEAAELKKIAARSPEPDLVFGTDEDFCRQRPPGQPLRPDATTPAFGKSRIALATELLKDLDQKVVKDGESWTPAAHAPSASCISQCGNGAYLAVGVHRRPVGLPRLQGDRQGARPDHPDQRRQAARGARSSWSTRSSATRRSSSRRPCSAS